jgi:hypothetical protein
MVSFPKLLSLALLALAVNAQVEAPATEAPETPAEEVQAEAHAEEESSEGAAANDDPPVTSTLIEPTVAGATAIQVASSAGFVVGGKITITGGGNTATAEITGFGSLVLKDPLALVFPAGSTVTQAELKRTTIANCFSVTDRVQCCKHKDGRNDFKDQDCVPAAPGTQFPTNNACEPACVIVGNCPNGHGYPKEPATQPGTCEAPTPPPTEQPTTATTTMTPWDSSASSSGDSGGSLDSSYSSSFKEDSFDSSAQTSIDSSGSAASGSSGSYMPLWMWALLLCCCCLCLAGGAAALMPKKKKKVPKKVVPKPEVTELIAPAPAGSTTLEVASTAGFNIGQGIRIDPDTPMQEVNEVIGYGSLIIKHPLAYEHHPGARIEALPQANTTTDSTNSTNSTNSSNGTNSTNGTNASNSTNSTR